MLFVLLLLRSGVVLASERVDVREFQGESSVCPASQGE